MMLKLENENKKQALKFLSNKEKQSDAIKQILKNQQRVQQNQMELFQKKLRETQERKQQFNNSQLRRMKKEQHNMISRMNRERRGFGGRNGGRHNSQIQRVKRNYQNQMNRLQRRLKNQEYKANQEKRVIRNRAGFNRRAAENKLRQEVNERIRQKQRRNQPPQPPQPPRPMNQPPKPQPRPMNQPPKPQPQPQPRPMNQPPKPQPRPMNQPPKPQLTNIQPKKNALPLHLPKQAGPCNTVTNERQRIICLMKQELKNLHKHNKNIQPIQREFKNYENNYKKINLHNGNNNNEYKIKMNESLLKMFKLFQMMKPDKQPIKITDSIGKLQIPIFIQKLSFPMKSKKTTRRRKTTKKSKTKILQITTTQKKKRKSAKKQIFYIVNSAHKIISEISSSSIKNAIKEYSSTLQPSKFSSGSLKATKKIRVIQKKNMKSFLNSRKDIKIPVYLYDVTKYKVDPKLVTIAKEKGFPINKEINISLKQKYFIKQIQK